MQDGNRDYKTSTSIHEPLLNAVLAELVPALTNNCNAGCETTLVLT